MAEKSLWFRMFGEDRVTPVFKKVGAEAEVTAAKVRGSFAEAGAMIGGPIGKGTSEANRGMKAMGHGSLMTAGVMIGAVGAIAYHTTKMAGDFQGALVRLETTAGESKKNLDVVSQGILDMAPKVGWTAQEIATGMYTVESAGFHGAEGLKVMEAAAKGARIEGADLATMTDAVTSSMVDFHMHGAKGATDATNILIAAVGHGKTTMEGMASAFPNVAAAAAAVHVSMKETASAIATMTQHGTDAAKAGTYLRQILGQLASGGSTQAQKAFAGLGLSAAGVSKEIGTQGLAATIGTLEGALRKHLTPAGLEALNAFKSSNTSFKSYHTLVGKMGGGTMTAFGALTKMVGGVKSLQAILQLGGENLKTFRHNTEAIGAAVRKGGNDVEGYSEYQKTYNARVADAKAALSALGVAIGTDVLPFMSKLMGALATGVAWLGKHKTATEIALVVLGTAGVALAVVTAATWAWNVALDANPISLIIIAIAGLVAGLVYAYTHFKTFRDVANGVFSFLKALIIDVINIVREDWPIILPLLLGPLGAAIVIVAKNWSTFKSAAEWAFHAVGAVARWLWNNALEPVFKLIVGGVAWLMGAWAHMLSGLSHVPGFGWAKTAAAQMQDAAIKAQNLADSINKIPPSKSIDIRYTTTLYTVQAGKVDNGGKSPKGHNALGTDYWPGGLTELGETGPEDVYLPPGAKVLSHAKTVATAHPSVAGVSNQRTAAPVTLANGQRVALTITNWHEGAGHMEVIADGVYTSRDTYAGTTGGRR